MHLKLFAVSEVSWWSSQHKMLFYYITLKSSVKKKCVSSLFIFWYSGHIVCLISVWMLYTNHLSQQKNKVCYFSIISFLCINVFPINVTWCRLTENVFLSSRSRIEHLQKTTYLQTAWYSLFRLNDIYIKEWFHTEFAHFDRIFAWVLKDQYLLQKQPAYNFLMDRF